MRSIFFMSGQKRPKKVSKEARRLLEFHGLPPETVKGTGKGGAITVTDAKKTIANLPAKADSQDEEE